METPYGVAVTVSHVADGHAGRVLADVPESDLTAHQSARQTLRVPVIELERDDRMRRLDSKIRNGGILFAGTVVISIK